MIATVFAVAIVIYSCSQKEQSDPSLTREDPQQTIDNMFAVKTQNGKVVNRMEAPLMERYENDTLLREIFPKGLEVYSYNEEGLLESIIVADNALHITQKKRDEEKWSAFGNVVMQNMIKQETMETDTIYWDQATHEIYTDCYVRMYSADGFLQGYGMRSDEKVNDACILNPFNGYSVVVQDTTRVVVDSVNFIGPFLQK